MHLKSIILRRDCRLPETSQGARGITKGPAKSWGIGLKILMEAQSSSKANNGLLESIGKHSGVCGEGGEGVLSTPLSHQKQVEAPKQIHASHTGPSPLMPTRFIRIRNLILKSTHFEIKGHSLLSPQNSFTPPT